MTGHSVKLNILCGKLDFSDPDSFKARVTRFYQTVSKKEEDSDSDSESGTSPDTVKEDIAIKEKKNLKWVSKPILLNSISFRTKVFYVTFKVFSILLKG